MYIITWYDEGEKSLAGNFASVVVLANIFENCKVYYKVSDRTGHKRFKEFSFGGFEFWLEPDAPLFEPER